MGLLRFFNCLLWLTIAVKLSRKHHLIFSAMGRRSGAVSPDKYLCPALGKNQPREYGTYCGMAQLGRGEMYDMVTQRNVFRLC